MTGSPAGSTPRSLSAVKSGGRWTSPCRRAKAESARCSPSGPASRWPRVRTTRSAASGSGWPARWTSWRPSRGPVTRRARSRCSWTVTAGGSAATDRAYTQRRWTPWSRRLGKSRPRRVSISARIRGSAAASAQSVRPSRTSAAQASSAGPGRTGPSWRTVSSVNIVTSSAMEFIHSGADWSRRQVRPLPGGWGSMRWRSSGRFPYRAGALAASRSTRPVARGPAPTTASTGRALTGCPTRHVRTGRHRCLPGARRQGRTQGRRAAGAYGSSVDAVIEHGRTPGTEDSSVEHEMDGPLSPVLLREKRCSRRAVKPVHTVGRRSQGS